MTAFSTPWVLWALPLALLPWWRRESTPLRYPSLTALPRDRLSDLAGWLLRLLLALAIALLLLALAGPHTAPATIERIGRGAQIVLLLDRSRSMDDTFASARRYATGSDRLRLSKGRVARDLLAEFAAQRHEDQIAMLAFSTRPIPILPLTDKTDVVQAAIRAGNSGRGLSQTDVGAGLERALAFFEEQAYTGSRVVLLVSDGGARLDLDTRLRLQNLFRRRQAALYWIYIRTYNSPGLEGEAFISAPERDLHDFFRSMGSPYRVYTAEDPQALEDAIADISRLQSLPIHYTDTLPGRDLADRFYAAALVCIALLIAARWLRVRPWRSAP